MARHPLVVLAAAIAASAVTATVLSAPRRPRMLADYAPTVSVAAVDPPALPRLINASAAREKQADPGVCDYPGPYVPCWCDGYRGDGKLPVRWDGRVGCTPSEYLQDVQEFGPPRFQVPIRGPETIGITAEIETE